MAGSAVTTSPRHNANRVPDRPLHRDRETPTPPRVGHTYEREMDMTTATHPVPDRVVVIGAGMVGLSTAWFLQEHGVQVTVLDRTGVAAGSSWGNAGWLTPGVATPLPEPAVLRYGLRAALSPSSPVYVPPSVKPAMLRFLTGFVRHSTMTAWKTAMQHLVPLNDLSLESFDQLKRGGVAADTRDAVSFLAAYRTEAERKTLLEEIEHIHAAGQDVEFEALTGDQARTIEPHLSHEIGAAILLRGQRFIDPGRYIHALAESVSDRGGKIIDSATVSRLQDVGSGIVITTAEGSVEQFDQPGLRSAATPAQAGCSPPSSYASRPAHLAASVSPSSCAVGALVQPAEPPDAACIRPRRDARRSAVEPTDSRCTDSPPVSSANEQNPTTQGDLTLWPASKRTRVSPRRAPRCGDQRQCRTREGCRKLVAHQESLRQPVGAVGGRTALDGGAVGVQPRRMADGANQRAARRLVGYLLSVPIGRGTSRPAP